MAGYFKKRKGPSGPNKNEQKVMRSREQQSRGRSTLSSRFSTVRKITVKLDFLSPQQHVLGQEARTFGSDDACDFTVSCPGQCGVGAFNLAAKVEQLVTVRQAACDTGGKCQEPLYAGAASVCGCELKCRIEVEYLPEAAEPAPAASAPAAAQA